MREARQAAAGLSAVRSPMRRDAARTSALENPAATSGVSTPCSAAARWPGRWSPRSSVLVPTARASPSAAARGPRTSNSSSLQKKQRSGPLRRYPGRSPSWVGTTRWRRPSSAARARASASSASARLGETPVAATARSPRARPAAASRKAESAPPENATITPPVASSSRRRASSLASRSFMPDSLGRGTKRNGGPPLPGGRRPRGVDVELEVHVAAAARHGGGLLLLRLVGHHGLGGQEQAGDRGRVLQGGTDDLGRVDDPRLEHVGVLAGGRVQALARVEAADLLDHHAALEAGVGGDLLQRLLERPADDGRPGRLVTGQVDLGQGVLDPQQGHAAAGDDALLDRRAGVGDSILDAVLLLLELDLGGRPDLDHAHAPGQLGQPLLELLAVVVGVGVLDLGPDLVDPALDVVGVALALDDGGLGLGDDHLAGPAEQVDGDVLELEADLLGDDLAAGQGGDVLEHGLAAVAEPGGLDGGALEGAADLVDDQGGQGLALDVLGDDHDRLAALHDLLQHREQVLDGRDLGVGDQEVGVVEDRLHPLGVGHEVGRDVALVEAHALDRLELDAEGVRLLDGDDAFLADDVHRLGDDLADLGVAGRHAGRVGDLVAGLDVLGLVLDGLDGQLGGLLDAALEAHRVGPGGDVAQALADQGLGEHGGGGGAVTGDLVGLLGDLLDELGPDLLPRVLELDLVGDGHAVVGDGGRAPLLLQDDVAALGTQRHPDGVGELVHPPLESAPGVLVEGDDLGHRCGYLPCSDGLPSGTCLRLAIPDVSTQDGRVLSEVLSRPSSPSPALEGSARCGSRWSSSTASTSWTPSARWRCCATPPPWAASTWRWTWSPSAGRPR